jgi:hypothetical protein
MTPKPIKAKEGGEGDGEEEEGEIKLFILIFA